MKRICGLLLGLFLACPVFAQEGFDLPQYRLPADVYDALVPIFDYHLTKNGPNGPEVTQEQLDASHRYLKGITILAVGYDCGPCNKMVAALRAPDATGRSMVDRWKAAGIRYYEYNIIKNSFSKDNVLFCMMRVKYLPVLYILKDGEMMTYDFGEGEELSRIYFDARKKEDYLEPVKKWNPLILP